MLAALSVAEARSTLLYVGTYGAGIYATAFDERFGRFSEPRLAAECRDPSFLALSPDRRRLVAALESSGRVAAFAVEGDRLVARGSQPSGGSAPCHVAFDGEGNVLVANYGDGVVASLPIAPDGTLSPAAATAPNSGSGPDAKRQSGPHAHFVASLAGFVYSCDLGTDEVRIFGNGLRARPSARVPAGAGARHLAFAGPYAFAANEMGISVTAFRRNAVTGELTTIATTPLLRGGEAPAGASAAEIATSPDHGFVYASVRKADTISAFRIGTDGRLAFAGQFPSGVREVRSFAISPDGRWIVAAGQESGDLVALPLDRETGAVGSVFGRVAIRGAKPVCVVFAAL